MIKNNIKGFTLVELLVVITIIAILGVVAYTSFGSATDKAKAAAKMQDVNAVKAALISYESEKGFYPKVGEYNASTNVWGFNSSGNAKKTNTTIGLASNADGEITAVPTGGTGGGKISIIVSGTPTIIGAKGTFSNTGVIKKFLPDDVYDRELGDVSIPEGVVAGGKKLIDYGVGRYVYATYKKGMSGNETGKFYNIAYTLKEKDGTYKTIITGNYNEQQCFDAANCPITLIGPGVDVLKNGDKGINIPYSLTF